MGAYAFAGLSSAGRVRAQNQDGWYADPGRGLFFVADGMGGHRAGAVAAQSVIAWLPPLVGGPFTAAGVATAPDMAAGLRAAISAVNVRLWQEGRARPGCFGMGATLVALLVGDDSAVVAHLGDSRAYRLRTGQLERLTHDHTLIQSLIDLGEISPEQARLHPARGKVSRHLGMQGEALPDVNPVHIAVHDRLLLCSDGLTNMVPDIRVAELLGTPAPPAEICGLLVAEANRAGGRDNVTTIVIDPQGPR